MRYINFLKISFCLLLNIFALYSSEYSDLSENESKNIKTDSSKRTLNWREILSLNRNLPEEEQLSAALTNRDTYRFPNGEFTTTKAVWIIHTLKEKFNLYENPTTFPHSESPSRNPMAWICSKKAITEAKFKEKERLEIGRYFFFQKFVDNGVIEKSLAVCMRNPEHNSTIIEFMQNKKEELHS